MSEKQTISSSSTKGKASTSVEVAPQPRAIAQTAIVVPEPSDSDMFVIASKFEALLKDKSNKACFKILNLVGSLHSIRCISVDRPIGRSTVGTAKVVPTAPKPKKGQPTPPAAWKQTDAYKRLNAQRESIVTTLKSLGSNESAKATHIADLRAVERQLKALKSPTAGNH